MFGNGIFGHNQKTGSFNAPLILTGRTDDAWNPFDPPEDRLDRLEEELRRLRSLMKIVLLGGLDG